MKQPNRKLACQLLTVLLITAALGISMPTVSMAESPEHPNASTYTCRYYKVKRGDTLTKISRLYGVSILTIRRVNRLPSTRIYTGTTLCIPVYKPQPAPQPSGPWYGEYWNNTSQSGSPALVRNDGAVDFNWAYGTPNPGLVFADYFSARWTRTLNFTSGTYRFTLNADDGIRLIIDGSVVFDRYGFVGNQTNQADIAIAAGVHTVRVDYVEQAGIASVRVNFVRVSGTQPGPQPCGSACPGPTQNGPWSAQFFNNINLDGAPVYMANYNGIQFNWGYGSPASSVPADNWGARFVQYRYFPAGVYRFVVTSDDGVRIYVDDRQVINQWVQQSARTVTGDIALGDGSHFIRVEFFDLSALAQLKVHWEYLGNPGQ